jgi:hypothetical protein
MTPSAWAKRFPRRSPSAAGGYQPHKSDLPTPPPPAPEGRGRNPTAEYKKELQTNLGELSDPPPMSDIAPAKAALQELNKAVARANAAWNRTQLVDALRSVRYWTEQAEKAAKIVAENA